MLKFGHRAEPFVDDYLIDSLENVSFRITKPENLGKVLAFDKPWEDLGSLAGTVIQNKDGIKLYYRGFPAGLPSDASELQTTCLAESTDGIHFTRAAINTVDYIGNKENNIVLMGKFSHNVCPFYDTNPACPENERYKAIAGTNITHGLHVFVSPDGINWTDPVGHPVITTGELDSMNTAFWDPHAGLYRCYSRIYHQQPRRALRAIQNCVSTDFIHWSNPIENVYENGPKDELYTNATRPMPGAEHVLFSIPMRFQNYRMMGDGNPPGNPGVSDAILMTSRDGINWTRTAKEPWLSGGLYDHEWTQRCFITAPGVVEMDKNWIFYVTKNYEWNDHGIWAYSVPKLRLMSLFADDRGGTVTSKLLQFAQDYVHINFSTSAYGSVKIKILDESGNLRFESPELYGNDISRRLHFEGLKNTVGRFVLEMNEANVYAIGSNMIPYSN